MNKSSIQSLSQLFFNPSHQYRNSVLLLFFCQQFSGWYMMPFEEATTATAACGMLGNKYRMPSHWCLLTVIGNYGRCKAFGNEILCMFTDCCQAFFFNIIFFPSSKDGIGCGKQIWTVFQTNLPDCTLC